MDLRQLAFSRGEPLLVPVAVLQNQYEYILYLRYLPTYTSGYFLSHRGCKRGSQAVPLSAKEGKQERKAAELCSWLVLSHQSILVLRGLGKTKTPSPAMESHVRLRNQP